MERLFIVRVVVVTRPPSVGRAGNDDDDQQFEVWMQGPAVGID